MNHLQKYLLLPLVMLMTAACDDNTNTLGIYSDGDGITNSTSTYEITTRSIKLDSVVANSARNFLGCITDPETGTDITADFAAQLYCFENYKLPERDCMIGEVDGVATRGIVQCDSCEIRLFFNNCYGDVNNPMKLQVYELSRDNIISEDSTYYSDVDLTKFLPAGATPLASRVFTPKDYNLSETALSSSKYNNNVRIVLPRQLGQRIMDDFYAHPEYFANAYHFIRKVLPGFYFRTSGGKGTMLSVYVGTMNLFYRFADTLNDSIYEGVTRFAATPEVIQSTHFDNEDVDVLLARTECTYLKTPAGICTEMTIPVDEVFAGKHATDSVSKASITLTRYNKSQDDQQQFGTPAELLMVRKQDMYSFFRNHNVADGRTSYTTSFSSTYNSYTFSNICRLLSYCMHEKTQALVEENKERKSKGLSTYSEAEWDVEWAMRNPDWNKVVLIPVATSSNSYNSSYGNINQQVSVSHDLSLNSVRLVGGDTKLTMQVVYSKFIQ